jgi:hypothetical protein
MAAGTVAAYAVLEDNVPPDFPPAGLLPPYPPPPPLMAGFDIRGILVAGGAYYLATSICLPLVPYMME